jgi:hypothetical protein
MKKSILITVLVAFVAMALPCTMQAKEKTLVMISKDRVEIQIGNVGYVYNPKTPETLVEVRVWLQPDRLDYDLSATNVSYGDFAKDSLTPSQAAAKWAGFVKKFEQLREEVCVIITD